ncbi:hypothetical protein TNCV_313081 [Trichonephila clavipes]|nr:hypothetical protein TNCV_313081 [Trichonephila clavipes]
MKTKHKQQAKKAGSSSMITCFPFKKVLEDKLKEKDKKKEPGASEQKNIQRYFVKKSDRTSRIRDVCVTPVLTAINHSILMDHL